MCLQMKSWINYFLVGRFHLTFCCCSFSPFFLPSCQKTWFPKQQLEFGDFWGLFKKQKLYNLLSYRIVGVFSSPHVFPCAKRDSFCLKCLPLTTALYEKSPPLRDAQAHSSPPVFFRSKFSKIKHVNRKRNDSCFYEVVLLVGKWYFYWV